MKYGILLSKVKIEMCSPSTFLCLALIPFLTPDGLSLIPQFRIIDYLFAIMRYFVAGIAIVLFLRRITNCRVAVFCIVYQSAVLLASAITGTLYITFGLSCLSFIGFCIVNYCCYSYSRRTWVKFYYWLMLGLLVLNVVSQICFPNGILPGKSGDSRVYLLGYKNATTLYLLAFLMFAYFNYEIEALSVHEPRFTIPIITAIISIMYIPSSTAVLAMIILLFLVLLSRFNIRYINCFLLAGLVIFFGVYVVGGQSGPIGEAVAGFFGKNSSFSGRSAIWARAIDLIVANPFGVGPYVEFDVWTNGHIVYSAHNTILDVAVRYGIAPALILVSGILLLILRADRDFKSHLPVSILLVLCVCSMMEAFEGSYIFWLIISAVQFRQSCIVRNCHSLE